MMFFFCVERNFQNSKLLQDPNEDLGLGFPYDTILGESRPARSQEVGLCFYQRRRWFWGIDFSVSFLSCDCLP